MVANITVQRMTVKDVHPCWELDQQCFIDGEAYDLDTFNYLLSNPQSVAKKIELPEGRMIGFAVGLLESGGVGHVISVGVAPEWRQQGLGRMLMVEMEREFSRRNATIARLEVRVDNIPAQQLYLRLGYTITQRLPRYYSNGNDALVMVKSLPEPKSFWRFGL